MLITKHFVFVHYQKTGGVFIKRLCRNYMPADWFVPNELNPHAQAHKIPAELSHLPVLGFVRNPWDWYVSWYHYVRGYWERRDDSVPVLPFYRRPGSAWTAVFDRGRASFEEVITAACSGVPADGHPAPPWMERMRAEGVDICSFWYEKTFRAGFEGTVEIGRFENLREDFIAFLRRHAVPVDDSFIQHVMASPPENVTERDPYASYYDAELRDLVGATNTLIDEHGYTFEG